MTEVRQIYNNACQNAQAQFALEDAKQNVAPSGPSLGGRAVVVVTGDKATGNEIRNSLVAALKQEAGVSDAYVKKIGNLLGVNVKDSRAAKPLTSRQVRTIVVGAWANEANIEKVVNDALKVANMPEDARKLLKRVLAKCPGHPDVAAFLDGSKTTPQEKLEVLRKVCLLASRRSVPGEEQASAFLEGFAGDITLSEAYNDAQTVEATLRTKEEAAQEAADAGVRDKRAGKFLDLMLVALGERQNGRRPVIDAGTQDVSRLRERCVEATIQRLKELGLNMDETLKASVTKERNDYSVPSPIERKLTQALQSGRTDLSGTDDSWMQPILDLARHVRNGCDPKTLPAWANNGPEKAEPAPLEAGSDPTDKDLDKELENDFKTHVKAFNAIPSGDDKCKQEDALEDSLITQIRELLDRHKDRDLSRPDVDTSTFRQSFAEFVDSRIKDGGPGCVSWQDAEKLKAAFAKLPPALMNLACCKTPVQNGSHIVLKVLMAQTGVKRLSLPSDKWADNTKAYAFHDYGTEEDKANNYAWENQPKALSNNLNIGLVATHEKNNYGYGDCFFLSVINGLYPGKPGADQVKPTHDNALKLRQAMIQHIEDLRSKRGTDAPKGFMDLGDTWLVAQGQEGNEFMNGAMALKDFLSLDERNLGQNIAAGTTFTDAMFVPFVADLIKRPVVVLQTIDGHDARNVMCFDRDLSTGLPLPGDPLVLHQTADRNGIGHFTTLQLEPQSMDNLKKILAHPPKT